MKEHIIGIGKKKCPGHLLAVREDNLVQLSSRCVFGRSKPCDNRRGLANGIPSCLGDPHFFLLTVLRFQWGGLGVTMGGLDVEGPGRKAGCVKRLANNN